MRLDSLAAEVASETTDHRPRLRSTRAGRTRMSELFDGVPRVPNNSPVRDIADDLADRTGAGGGSGVAAQDDAVDLHGLAGAFLSVVRQEPRAIPAGLFVRSGLSDDDLLYAAARRIPHRSGRLVVVARGDHRGGVVSDGRSVNPRVLAGLIRRSPGWKADRGASIWLFSCAVSADFAQELGELLRVRVRHGENGLTWIGPGTGGAAALVTAAAVVDGRLVPVMPPTGRWVERLPGADQPVVHEAYAFALRQATPAGLGLATPMHLRAPRPEPSLPAGDFDDDRPVQERVLDEVALTTRRGAETLRHLADPLLGDGLVERLARGFAQDGGDGWEELARAVGLGGDDGLPDDFRQTLVNVAELALLTTDVGADGRRSTPDVPQLQRVRTLIEAGFTGDRDGADFYRRTVGDVRRLLADLPDPGFNTRTGPRSYEEVSDGEVRGIVRLMDSVIALGGYRSVVAEIGAEWVGGGRLLPVMRLAQQLHPEGPDLGQVRDLAWLAHQIDNQHSRVGMTQLRRVIRDINGSTIVSADSVGYLVRLVGETRRSRGLDSLTLHDLRGIWAVARRWDVAAHCLEDITADSNLQQFSSRAQRLRSALLETRSAVIGGSGPEASQPLARIEAEVSRLQAEIEEHEWDDHQDLDGWWEQGLEQDRWSDEETRDDALLTQEEADSASLGSSPLLGRQRHGRG